MANFSESLSRLLNPTPTYFDPLNDENDETSARVVDKSDVDNVTEAVEPSHIRKRAAISLSEGDKRYAGRKVSRQKLLSSDDDIEDEDEDIGDEDNDGSIDDKSMDEANSGDDPDNDPEASEESEDDLAAFRKEAIKHKEEFSYKDDGDYSKFQEVSEEDNEDEEEEGDDSDEEDNDSEGDTDGDIEDTERNPTTDESNQIDGDVVGLKAGTNVEVEKGRAAKMQISLWDSLLECRIKLQKSLVCVNQLPQPSSSSQFLQATSDELQQALKEGKKTAKHLLDQLVELQTRLLMQNEETKMMVIDNTDDNRLNGVDGHSTDPGTGDQSVNHLKRKLKTSEYPEFLSKRHKEFLNYRNATIEKWYDKTRVSSGRLTSKSFNAFDQSAVKQIEQILSDRTRLVKRTQLKRSIYRVQGQEEVTVEKQESNEQDQDQDMIINREPTKEYDSEIFDDDDFYHQLLRELIERKTTDINDPIALSRQWLEMQKLRRKSKKRIDTKASKGRKVRYDIHPKLVNFMAPRDNSSWTEESKDDLFSSLFGQRNKTGESAVTNS